MTAHPPADSTLKAFPKLKHQHVIVCGYGPVGRLVAGQLEAMDVDITIIDLNERTVQTQRGLKRRILHGDATSPETLRAAGIDRADALILTMPNEDAAHKACQVARSLCPNIFIAARTRYLSKGMLVTQAGADQVIVEEVVTAEAMQHAVVHNLMKLGKSKD